MQAANQPACSRYLSCHQSRTYPNKISTVKLGATKSEGGTRGRTVTIGGEVSPAFYSFENPIPHKPVITLDVFDMEVPLSKAVKMHVKDVVGDPAAWAKLAVEKFGADMVTMHLISVDPLLKDASPKDACKTIEKVLQAVDVPLVIGGCGDPVKDTAVFEEVCAQFPGERFLISSVTRDMDVEKCAKFIKKAGHAILSFTPMDLNLARELNRRLYDYVAREDIVMDLTTAALRLRLRLRIHQHGTRTHRRINGRPRTRTPNVLWNNQRLGSP